MRLKPIPRSKAKTAYGLVSDVIRAMEAEPKRVNMHVLTENFSPALGGPACGTVGCFAGWTSLLKSGSHRFRAADLWVGVGRSYGPAEAHARRLLGHCDYHDPKIGSLEDGYVFAPDGVDLRGKVGTRQYARTVIARIKRFQKKNAAYLKARKLDGAK